MSRSPEIRAAISNIEFYYTLRKALKTSLEATAAPKILDYGTGRGSLFTGLAPDAELTAYEPSLSDEFLDRTSNSFLEWSNLQAGMTWTKTYPKEKVFDLVIASYSLHHVSTHPVESVADFARNTSRVAIADYDFSNANLDEFKQGFISGQEQAELHKMFGGNIEAAFAFHKRFGISAYLQALTCNGFDFKAGQFGEDAARFKFFLIGERPQ